MLAVEGDTPTHRLTIAEMDDADIEIQLEGTRIRRLQALNTYQQAQALKMEAKTEKQYDRLIKLCNMMEKDFIAANKAIEKLEKRALDIRSLRLEIEG
jgi:hypothetical protein